MLKDFLYPKMDFSITYLWTKSEVSSLLS